MHDLDAVLTANDSFYRAFAENDMPAMEALWAERSPVACIHPGWPPLSGRADVLESWRRILSNPGQDAPSCTAPEALLFGDMALVLCFEEIAGQVLVASNYFIQEAGRWRLVHHQSGPVNEAPRAPPTPPRRSLH